ncbi:DENN domain-containing protein 11 isoform X2 [Tachyglossus aculeatus]|uniref:DENN domain-containing protein 11 isoform X2 n=1 Tax=Tachyglossus aculeatus TaxID=9261 RepID=UPI0018F35628|nr:DENN domain-containing protein 11 isoform X2 [Tachyglossus aculeatus]
MVEQGDEAPLLCWAEGPAVSPPQRVAQRAAQPQHGNREGRPEQQEDEQGDRGDQEDEEEEDHIVAVFVVTFDPRTGNMVEWCLPQDIDLEGVEFKSMASGSHKIQSDFIYFRKGAFFGLACFANMPVESELERGARMKSVGVLSPSYTLLYRYMHFLENQVRHQLETPGYYSHLAAFYEDKKGVLPVGKDALNSRQPVHWLPSIHRYMYPEMKITHPAGCMSQFIKFFGEQILVLWKFALLRKRILIFSPPPVGVVCYRVYCCCCLANVSLPGVGGTVPDSKPFFYVNVADIDSLQTQGSYVACTTEKIFEEKRDLYDVYVDNQNVRTHHEHLQPLLKVNGADKEKYRRLNDQRCCSIPRRWEKTAPPAKRISSSSSSWSRTTGYSRLCWRCRRARIRR